jgi:hypothetical protein
LLQNKAKIPKIMACHRNPKEPPLKSGGVFLLESVGCCQSVANMMDRTQWFYNRGWEFEPLCAHT